MKTASKSIALVAAICLFATYACAGTIDLMGFQGTFGDVTITPATPSLNCIDGATSGETVSVNLLTASLSDQVIDLSTWVTDGDDVIVTNLVLTGTGDVIGVAEYEWEVSTLSQLATPDMFGGAPIGMGGVQGTLRRVSNTLENTSSGDDYDMPELITAALTYNGAYIEVDDQDNATPVLLLYQSASISVQEVPEPSSALLTLMATFGLVAFRRRK